MKNLLQIKLITRIAIALLILFPIAGMAHSSGRDVTLKSLEIGENGLSITINTDGKANTRSFVLSSPTRWVLDISPAIWSGDIQQVFEPQNTQYFGKIRIGQWRSKTARLVIHTNGANPTVETTEGKILISFGETPSSANAEPIKQETPSENKSVAETGSNDTAVDTGSTDLKTVEVPRVLPVSDYKAQPAIANTSQTSDNSQSTQEINSAKSDKFEITCDGSTTRILINLTKEQTFDVQSLKYPDRLLVQYPASTDTSGSKKIRFKSIDRERLPVGIIGYVSRFESTSVPQITKLVFEADKQFNYSTSIDNGILKIDIRSLDTAARTPLDKAAAGETKPIETSNLNTPGTAAVTILDGTAAGSGKEEKTGDTQKFNPPDTPSFVIDKNKDKAGSEHTVPESSGGIKLKEVTTSDDSETVSIKDMVGSLPEFAPSKLKGGEKALEKKGDENPPAVSDSKQGDIPLMIEPPEEYKPLPKGSRPAADLFLTKGESIIIPVKGIVRASVGDPEAIAINVLSTEELLVTAKKEGRTTLILWEQEFGRSVRWVNVGSSSLMKVLDLEKVINNPNIKVSFIGANSVVLEGKVATEEERERAKQIAGGAAEKVISLIEMTNPKRVLVKVRIVEVQSKDREDFLKKLGTGTRTETGDFQFNVLSDILNPEIPGGGLFDISVHPGIVHGNSGDEKFDPIDIALNYLEQSRKGKILSQPNLVVLSGRAAHFRVGGEVPYTYMNESGFNVVNFREFGIVLDVTPSVDSDNNILVQCAPTVRTVDNTLAIAGIPGFRTREVKTDIQVKDRQTIVIGGLLQHEIVTTKSKVPILGDIPFIGEMFKSKKHTDEETELLVFLTPSVLKDVASVESEIKSDEDVSLSPYYQKEVVEKEK